MKFPDEMMRGGGGGGGGGGETRVSKSLVRLSNSRPRKILY